MAFFIALFARFLVPVYWGASIIELFVATRRCRIAVRKRAAISIVSLQLVAPFLYFLLYPIMPGSTWNPEPVGMSEKTGNTVIATTCVCLGLMLASVAILARKQPRP